MGTRVCDDELLDCKCTGGGIASRIKTIFCIMMTVSHLRIHEKRFASSDQRWARLCHVGVRSAIADVTNAVSEGFSGTDRVDPSESINYLRPSEDFNPLYNSITYAFGALNADQPLDLNCQLAPDLREATVFIPAALLQINDAKFLSGTNV